VRFKDCAEPGKKRSRGPNSVTNVFKGRELTISGILAAVL
jgi:hypothetical protein